MLPRIRISPAPCGCQGLHGGVQGQQDSPHGGGTGAGCWWSSAALENRTEWSGRSRVGLSCEPLRGVQHWIDNTGCLSTMSCCFPRCSGILLSGIKAVCMISSWHPTPNSSESCLLGWGYLPWSSAGKQNSTSLIALPHSPTPKRVSLTSCSCCI